MSVDNPFVGLRSFESDESLLFFGRQEQTLELLQRLHQYHFVAVTGGSGSGKSSLIKAGLIPRLKAGYLVNDNDRWVIAVMKPGQSPICNLADAVLGSLKGTGNTLTSTALEQKINKEGVDAILEILEDVFKNNTNVLLLVDQFEELFRFFLNQQETVKKDEAIDFVNILLELTAQRSLPVYIVITMRSDFIGDCSQFYGLPEAMNQSQYIVPRLNRVQLRNTIEGPVRLYKGSISPALTTRLLNDAQIVKDELPLLQHCLMRIWDRNQESHQGNELDLEDYRAVGGIEKALSNHADEAIKEMPETELRLTKKIFQALTIIDENGRKIRRPARLSELESITGADSKTLLSIINRFIEDNRSFLIISKVEGKDDYLIDISHESLIRQWEVLNTWVDEEAESGKIFIRLTESAALYRENKKNLLIGNELQQVLHWYYSFQPAVIWAGRYSAYFQASIDYLKKSEQEEKKQRQRRIRNKTLLAVGAVLVVIIISWFAVLNYKNNIRGKEQLALNYWNSSQNEKATGNYSCALHLIAEAAAISNNKELVQDLLIDGESWLPQTALNNIFACGYIVNDVVFSADGNRILIAGNDGSARILDKITGKQAGPDRMHGSPVTNAVFSHDGKYILTTCSDKTARIWDVAAGTELYSLNHQEDVTSAVFSSDDKLVLTGSIDGFTRVWDAASGQPVTLLQQDGYVNSISFNTDGSQVLIAGKYGTPHLWDLATRKQITSFVLPVYGEDIMRNAFFSHDSKKLLAIGADSCVRIFDSSGQQSAILKHSAGITNAMFSPDDKWILTASEDKSACLWDIETQSRIGAEMKHEGPVYAIAFSPDGKQVLTAGFDKTIKLWDIAARPIEDEIKTVFRHTHNVNSVAFSADGTRILTASADSTARIWDVASGKQLASLRHSRPVSVALFSPDKKWILTGSGTSAHLWDAVTYEQKMPDMNQQQETLAVAFSPDNKFILTAGSGNNIWVWDAVTCRPLTSFEHTGTIKKLVFSPDGKYILIACDSSACLLDEASKTQLVSFRHDDLVSDASFSPDGKRILTASYDRTARLWDVATGRQIGPAMKHGLAVNSAAYSKDGNWIITCGWDMSVHLWSATTLKEIGAGRKYRAPLFSVDFSPDGRRILTGGYDATARLSEIAGDLDMPPDLFKLQARAITGLEYNLETSETQCIPTEQWRTLKERYYRQGQKHSKTCKYLKYNLWRRFYQDKAPRINK